MPLAGIIPTEVRSFVSDLHAAGLAPATVRKTYNVFRAIMGAAEESSLIGRSPCVGIKLPKAARRTTVPEPGGPGAAGRYGAPAVPGADPGRWIRRPEIRGARRADDPPCRLLRSRLTVVESIVEVAGQLHRGPTKTGPSRVVTLPRFVTESLAEHVKKHPPGEDGLVFTAPGGGPIRRSSWRSRVWVDGTKRANVHPLRIHDLRHTAAALAIKAGAHPKAIADRLGHASITTTLNTYGHLFPALDEQLAERLDSMGRPIGSNGRGRRWEYADPPVIRMTPGDVERP